MGCIDIMCFEANAMPVFQTHLFNSNTVVHPKVEILIFTRNIKVIHKNPAEHLQGV